MPKVSLTQNYHYLDFGNSAMVAERGKSGDNMENRNSFTKEELAIAKSADLTDVARNLGYTVRKVGNYHSLKEMDSIRIYNRRSWYRW